MLYIHNMQGNSIHVQIYPPAMIKLRTLLQEGKVYYFDSFSVRYANRTYRPVTNPLMISFTKWTTLEECIDASDDFPAITFSLTPFQDAPSLVDKNAFYVGITSLSLLSSYVYFLYISGLLFTYIFSLTRYYGCHN